VKTFLISIFILLVLVAAFSTIESRIEFEYPFGNWAVPGNGGQPVPGDGEPGNANTFSFGSAESKEETKEENQDFCPISVEIVTETQEEQKESVFPFVLIGICFAFEIFVFVFAICCFVEYFKEKKDE
jgi:hypothetical protein